MPHKRKTRPARRGALSVDAAGVDTDVRIIGGRFRGRRLRYHGDPVVRPMKHRVREAIFNLISTDVIGRHAIDLFAGTGALGLEAISRGAASATLIEKHVPTARIVEENIRTLEVEDCVTLLVTSAFLWAKRDLVKSQEPQVKSENDSSTLDPRTPTGDSPWLVFCSPPYDFFVDRRDEMFHLLGSVRQHAPASSVLVVEADERFDFGVLTASPSAMDPAGLAADAAGWRVCAYPPAVIGIWAKE